MPAGALALVAPLPSEEAGALPRQPQDHLGPGGVPRVPEGYEPIVTPAAEAACRRAVTEAEIQSEAFAQGANQVWISWQGGALTITSATANVTMTHDGTGTWGMWNQAYATSATTTTATAWTGGTWVSWNTPVQESEDQRREREERQRADAERRAREDTERKAAQAKASDRALELLKSVLTAAQWEDYQGKGWFEVRGSRGGRWRIRNKGQSGNVDLMPEIGEVREASFCAHPSGWLPDADAHLAQMLALVTDEEEFVRVANVHHGRRPVYEPLEPARERELLAA